MKSSTNSIDLVDSLVELNLALLKFTDSLRTSKMPFWLPGKTARNLGQAASLYGDIWYQNDQDGRTTRSQHGLIGANAGLVSCAIELNNAKAVFQKLATEYRLSQSSELQQSLHRRTAKLAELLHRQGASRLHLKQCYRQIPVIETPPVKIGFSWYTSGRSIRKLTPKQAEERLLKMDTSQPHIQLQLQAVGNLRPGDMLAQIQTQVPVMRANILWKQDQLMLRKARNTSLPIIVALDDENPSLPEYNEPPLTPPEARSRLERSDLRIDPQPFLPSLRAHRYLG